MILQIVAAKLSCPHLQHPALTAGTVTVLQSKRSVLRKSGSLVQHDTSLNADPNPRPILSLSLPIIYP